MTTDTRPKRWHASPSGANRYCELGYTLRREAIQTPGTWARYEIDQPDPPDTPRTGLLVACRYQLASGAYDWAVGPSEATQAAYGDAGDPLQDAGYLRERHTAARWFGLPDRWTEDGRQVEVMT